MNSSQHFEIHMKYRIYQALKEISDERYDEWPLLNKKDLMSGVMTKTHGHYNPKMVEEIIEELFE